MLSVVLKDYLDSLHDLALATDYVSFFGLVKATLSYVLQSLGLGVYYILTFQWLRDILELPVVFKHTYTFALEGGLIKGKAAINLAVNNGAFSFLDASPANRHSLFSGFFNGFFLSLPVSVPQLLTLRTLLVNGKFACIASFIGMFCGQFLFYFCMLFGLDFIMQPFFQFDLVIILIGCLLTSQILYDLINAPDLSDISHHRRSTLICIGLVNCSLTWFEQVCVSNYFGNVTVNPGFSLLETTNSPHFFFMTFVYLIGLMIGFTIWSFGFYFVCGQLYSYLYENKFHIGYYDLKETINSIFVISLLAATMSSFFYYGYDYIGSKTLNYVEEDIAMAWTAPGNRHLIEITGSMEIDDVDVEQEDEDVISDGIPFHSGDQRPESAFEVFAIQMDSEEVNKEMHRERVEEKTGLFRTEARENKLKYEADPKYYVHRELDYTLSDLDFEQSFGLYKGTNIWEDMNLKIINSLFRSDEYEAFRDMHTSSYIPETQLYRQFRDKYNTNILYRKLMRLNNFSFLSGQPKTSNLSAFDEISLFNHRTAMQRYLESVHRYKHIIREQGTTFPEKIYNQQFKGSLSFVRKFNAVEISEVGEQLEIDSSDSFGQGPAFNPGYDAPKKVLKYDQPLYKKTKDESLSLMHEELPRKRKFKPKRFLKSNDTRPLYIGWDNMLRKFMIKSAVIGPGFKTDFIETEKGQFKDKQIESEGKGAEIQKKTEKTKNSTKQTSKKNKKGVKKRSSSANKKTPRWKKLFASKQKSKLMTRLRIKKDVCDLYEPVKKRPVTTKRSLPDYYHFQAWSPGVENAQMYTRFKLPTLIMTDERGFRQIQSELELIPELDDDEEYDPRDIEQRKSVQRKADDLKNLRDIFRRLPLYDWYWQMLDLEHAEYAKSFQFADSTYPKVDGIAWPGQNSRYGLTCPGFETYVYN